MKLPGLLLDADLNTSLALVRELAESPRNIAIDAGGVLAIEPVGACLIANGLRRHATSGFRVAIQNANPRIRQLIERLNCSIQWGDQVETMPGPQPQAPTLAREVKRAEADAAANQLAEHIASFVPSDMKAALQEDEYGAKVYHAVQPALAYVLAELLDNVFSHALTVEFPNPSAWIAAQYYPTGDLMRVAVVDNGCGLLGSLRALDPPPKNHFEAAALAFTPFVSSKSKRAIYVDRLHMGMGLSVCREICRRLDGRIYSASGNAQLVNPGITAQEQRNQIDFFQGTIISLEFHREAATSRTLRDALEKCIPKPSVDVRFE